jgi:hypothetical protein
LNTKGIVHEVWMMVANGLSLEKGGL